MKRTFWKLDEILVLLLELELSLQGSVSHSQNFVVSHFVILELLRRKSRKSLIIISFLPGGVDVCDPSEAAKSADRVVRCCMHQGCNLVEGRLLNTELPIFV